MVTRQLGPFTRAVNSGTGNQALKRRRSTGDKRVVDADDDQEEEEQKRRVVSNSQSTCSCMGCTVGFKPGTTATHLMTVLSSLAVTSSSLFQRSDLAVMRRRPRTPDVSDREWL